MAIGWVLAGLAAAADPDYPRVASFTPPDLAWVPRTLTSQPAFASDQVRWCIIVLGAGRSSVMAMAWDESAGPGKGYDTLYADTDLDGVLGEAGEQFVWSNDPAKRPAERKHHERYLIEGVAEKDSDRVYSFRFAGVYKPDQIEYDSVFRMSSTAMSYEVGLLPGELKLRWGDSLAAAPVYRFGGEPVPQVSGKHAGTALGTWKAGTSVAASVTLALHGAPAEAEFRFYGSKYPSLAEAVRDNRWGRAGYPIVLLRVLDPANGSLREIIPFGDSCPCAGGFAPQMILPSRVPAGNHEVVVRMLRTPELGGSADYIWPVTVENPLQGNPLPDPAFAALKQQFPDASFATLRRANAEAERATLRDGEMVVPTVVTDTSLLPSSRDWDARHANFGHEAHLTVGHRPHQNADVRSLLRFDLGGVPKQTEILGARLRLALIVAGEGGPPTFAAEDALEAFPLRRPWNESQDDAEGWACWFGPRFRGTLRETWNAEGAAGADTDRDAKPAGSTTGMRGYPDKAELIRFIDLDLTAVVKDWHTGKRSNHGVLLQMRGKGGGTIASSEQGDFPFRPALLLAYRGAVPKRTFAPRPGEDLDRVLRQARQARRQVVLRFYSESCGICTRVEATTFADARVKAIMGELLSVRVDIERQQELAQNLGVESIPAIVVVEPENRGVLLRIAAQEMAQPETLLPRLAMALPARPRAALPSSAVAVAVDGVLDEACWATAGVVAPMQRESGGGESVVATRVLALAAPDALLLAAICPEPKPEAIVAKATAHDEDQVYLDDCLEFFVEPVKGFGDYLHLIVSAGGLRYDGRNTDKAWNGAWTAAVKRTPEGWTVEARIPWATLGLAGPPKAGEGLGFNVGRLRNADGESSQWSLTSGSSHQPARFGTLVAP